MTSLDLVALRREFHRRPEPGFAEFCTAARVQEVLTGLGVRVRTGTTALDPQARLGVPSDQELDEAYRAALQAGHDPNVLEPMRGGCTAVVAEISGTSPGPTIGFRFDMDALPVCERTDMDHRPAAAGFASERAGLMHACGHDGHTAIGLGLAERLATGDFPGTVRLLFQPAEEGSRGAVAMVAAGAADRLAALFCLHLGGGSPLGQVNPASTGWLVGTKLVAEFTGRAAHAGTAPQEGRNALLAAAQALVALHALPPFAGETTRVNVGVLHGGSAPNVIAADAHMRFETRASSEAVNTELVRRSRTAVRQIAAAHEVDVAVSITGQSAEIRNDERAADLVSASVASVAGATLGPGAPTSASEDAGYLMAAARAGGGVATYLTVGAGGSGPHHSSGFDIDERCLPIAVDLLEATARRSLLELAVQ